MFTICIDNNGFYKKGNDGELVEVIDIPVCVDLTTCKYNRDTKTLDPPEEAL